MSKGSGSPLVLQATTERPSPGGVHIDRIDIRDEDVDGAPQWYRQSLSVPGIVRHVELLKQNLADPRESLQDTRISAMNRDRRIIVIEVAGESQRGDRRTKAPAEMPQALDEMRRQPEVIGAQLPVIT